MTLVVDASVVVKWLLNDPERKQETERATQLMQWIADGGEPVIQPAHWLIEVGAVLARISPDVAEEDLAMLQALELPVEDGPEVIRVPADSRSICNTISATRSTTQWHLKHQMRT